MNQNTALLMIDMQQGFSDIAYWGGGRNNPEAESNAALLLQQWRAAGWRLFHVKHNSTEPQSRLHPDHPGNAFIEAVTPQTDEPVIEKNVNSAFIGTDLQQRLQDQNISTLVVVGLTTDHCVSTTTRMAGNLGFEVFLVEDAIATFDKVGFDGTRYPAQQIHDTALASLHHEFAQVVSLEKVLQMLKA
ncbi:cysteine hydrolase family protein [Marinicella sp. W31]|uniref:cysteine hydrolase family protein n=1 Tax=Marinicella sp. W31 TaxID=3023713 RepID=UPI0037575C6E